MRHINECKPGDVVHCPPDGGQQGYPAKVVKVGESVKVNMHLTAYVWVTVETMDGGSRHVWPSHRIGFRVTP